MCLVLALLSIICISLLLTNITSGVCVNNFSSRAIHAEVYQRDKCGGLFGNPCFSKRVNKNSKECCDAGNADCRTGTSNDALYWIDCDTDARKSQGFGQAVVACSNCDINVDDSGMIVVIEANAQKNTRAVYACKYT